MHITHNNKIEPVIDFDAHSATIKQTLNGDFSLGFFMHKTDRNFFCYSLVEEEATVTVDGENFVIKSVATSPYGKSVTAIHEFFELNDEFVDGILEDGWHDIHTALHLAFNGGAYGWSYRVHDTFASTRLKDFGDDNPIALLTSIHDAFGAEYSVSSKDKTVHIKKRIGIETEYQVRYKHNLVAIDKQIDSSDVKTTINVRYNKNEDGTYASIATYTSPYANRYPKLKKAPTVEFDTDDITVALAYGASQIVDTPSISIVCEFVHLKEAGYSASDIALGNSFYLYDPRMNENDLARIVAIERYPYAPSKTPKVTLANRVKYMPDIAVEQRRKHLLLNAEAVKLKDNNGGVVVTEEEGITVIAEQEKSIKVMMNAKEGILIKNGAIKKFYVDLDGNVTFDGRLLITKGDGATPMLEAFLDEFGGRLLMYDVDGNLNLKMGSEETSETNRGGILKLYDDGEDRLRVSLGATAEYGGNGSLKLYDSANVGRIFMAALNDPILGGLIGIADETGSVKTSLTLNRGQIGGENIATEAYVNSIGDTILDELTNYIDDKLSGIESSITSLQSSVASLQSAVSALQSAPAQPTEE